MVGRDHVVQHGKTEALLRLRVPALNVLNGSEILTGLFPTIACCLTPHAYFVLVASFFLELAFSVQKATSKLLNNAFYATLRCHIRKLP